MGAATPVVRAVLDPNVLSSAVISPRGAPAQLLSCWQAGEFELIVSRQLLAELRRALRYPKLRDRVPAEAADELLGRLRELATVAADPRSASRRTRDPGDDYLVALAEAERAVLVTGDAHVRALGEELPIRSPRDFLDWL